MREVDVNEELSRLWGVNFSLITRLARVNSIDSSYHFHRTAYALLRGPCHFSAQLFLRP